MNRKTIWGTLIFAAATFTGVGLLTAEADAANKPEAILTGQCTPLGDNLFSCTTTTVEPDCLTNTEDQIVVYEDNCIPIS